MPSSSKRGSCHMPVFWSLMPIVNACAPAGAATHAAAASASARRIREREVTGSSSAEGETRTRSCRRGRLRTDSDSDLDDEPARFRCGEPSLEGVELLHRAGMVATDPAAVDRTVEAPARAGRQQGPPAPAAGAGGRVREHPEAVAAADARDASCAPRCASGSSGTARGSASARRACSHRRRPRRSGRARGCRSRAAGVGTPRRISAGPVVLGASTVNGRGASRSFQPRAVRRLSASAPKSQRRSLDGRRLAVHGQPTRLAAPPPRKLVPRADGAAGRGQPDRALDGLAAAAVTTRPL